MDYVQEEILDRQPQPIQRFLLQTAVLRRMSAALCTALTEDPASQAMLELLERRNLFVVPLDEQRQWYRTHDVFREVLLARLHATAPALIPQLHQRAAHWYTAAGEPREAIAHALAGADFAFAADLIEREATRMWLSGEAQAVLAWIAALPDDVLWQHARLALKAALRLLETFHATVRESYARAQVQVEQVLARVEGLLRSRASSIEGSEAGEMLPALPDAQVALIERRIGLLRALIASRAILTRGDAERMRLLAQQTAKLAEQEELSWKMIALWINFWLVESLQCEGVHLIPSLLEAKQQMIAAGDPLATVRVMRWIGRAYMRAGQLNLIQQECLDAQAIQDQLGEHSAMTGYFYFYLAHADYACNRLEAAAGSVQHMLRIAQAWQQVDLLVFGYVYRVWLALAGGDLVAAQQALQTAEDLIAQEHFTTHAGAVAAARVQCWLAAGNLDAARAWAAQVELCPEACDPNRRMECLMLVRVYLADGQYPQALAALERFSAALDRPGDRDTVIHFLALRVVALHFCGDKPQARCVAARLLALTEPESYIRVYLDAGDPMRCVLQSLLDTPRDQDNRLSGCSLAFVSRLLAAFPERLEAGDLRRVEHTAASSLQQPASTLAEPLTRREHEVLRLLVAGASNQEIAGELVISLATAKKHVGNLLGKLGVASRTQVIARVREWSQLF
jgi:LuxR family maltose regulon positive regulatory protein